MWFMPRAAREGRGGDSGWAFTDRIRSRMLETYSPEEIEKRVAERLQDPDVAAWPNLVHLLHYPTHHEAWFDIVLNDLDGDWYEERNPINLARNIDIPVYLQIDQGRGWTVDGHIELFDVLQGPQEAGHRLLPADAVAPLGRGARRDVPLVRVLAEGRRQRDHGRARRAASSSRARARWSPPSSGRRRTSSTGRCTCARAASSPPEPELMGPEHAAPDGFYQAPLTVTDTVEILSWSTPPFEEATELIGTGAAHLFAEIDQPDTNFILRLWDAAPNGSRQLITTGFLKASHRELDERTTEGNPYHPHTRAVPVEPGAIEEYVLRLYPFASTFRPGHRLVVELSNDEPLADDHNSLLPPDAFHLPVGRPVTHKIYRDALHPSRLVLPFTTRKGGLGSARCPAPSPRCTDASVRSTPPGHRRCTSASPSP